MSIRSANFEDLLRVHYTGTGAAETADLLKKMLSGHGPKLELGLLNTATHIRQSSALLFTPIVGLLRFYALLEIAYIAKFIPEPDYMDGFWKDTAANLAFLLSTANAADDNYPMVLPRFLLGRLEGRIHLEEEGIYERHGTLAGILLIFYRMISPWRHPEVAAFVEIALSEQIPHTLRDDFRSFVGDKDRFMAAIGSTTPGISRPDPLLWGFSETLSLCEGLDRLLEEAKPFPLLQSAMWTYYAELFPSPDSPLPSFVMQAVGSFAQWVADEPESKRAGAVNEYIVSVKEFMGRLSSGNYGRALSPNVLEPAAPVMA